MRSLACFLLLLGAVPCGAARINGTITGGTADLVPNGAVALESFSLSGPGFSFTGSGANSFYMCGQAPCLPGDPLPSLFAGLSSEDRGIGGTLTIGTTSDNFVELPGFPGFAGIEFDFSLSTPFTNPPATLTLSGPFTSTAYFADPRIQSGNEFFFSGNGTVTVDLFLFGNGTNVPYTYNLRSAHFDFGSVPEPGTGVMAVVVLAVFGIRRFRK